MPKATLATIDRKVTSILSRLPKAAAAAKPALPTPRKGEIYVGGIINPDGSVTHTFLLAGEKADVTWKDALAWAKAQGGDLPNRVEQALLWAHHSKHFQQRWYWSNEQFAADSDYAWSQRFYYGGQSYWHKDSKTMARAVRRETL